MKKPINLHLAFFNISFFKSFRFREAGGVLRHSRLLPVQALGYIDDQMHEGGMFPKPTFALSLCRWEALAYYCNVNAVLVTSNVLLIFYKADNVQQIN